MSDSNWHEVSRWKHKSVFQRLKFPNGGTSNVNDLAKISISVYMAKFPSHLTVRELWNICGKVGTLADVFIAKCRNALGQMFGFFCYIKVNDQERLINSLSNIWIGKLQLFANLAKFGRKLNGKPTLATNQNGKPLHAKPKVSSNSNSYVNVANEVSGNEYKHPQSTQEDAKTQTHIINLSQDKPNDFPLALLGCFKDFRAIANSRNLCRNEGFLNVDIKYLGGLWVLFNFETAEAKDNFLKNKGIMSWFSILKPWYDEFVVEERLIWLEIEGSGSDCDDSDEEVSVEHVDIDNVHIQSHSSTPEEKNGKSNDSDPFELEHLINKSGKSHKPCHSVTPDYPLGFSSVLKGDQVTFDSIQKLSDGDHIQQPSFSMLERLKETIKIGSNLGLNMEGCESTLASIIAAKGDPKVRWIMVYAPQSLSSKINLWSTLSDLLVSWDGISAVMGDLNEVENECERFESFPHATGLAMKKGIPDHRPIFLKESTVDYGPTPFRFFHSWLELDGFHELVVIQSWIASRRSNNYALKKEHENKLSAIDKKVDLGSATDHDFINRRDSHIILGNTERIEAKDYAQKAKIKWALEGDENNKFFHGTWKKKRRQLAIRGILKDAQCCSPSIDSLSFTTISQTQRDYLEIPFSRDEIKRAIWDCGGERAPGLDGFTFRFFTTFWDTIEKDVVRFVQEFFQSHVIPKGCNPSFISLIPKVPDAKFVSDFLPISLIGCQYKIIGKLLANRLCNVIKDCISPVQSAFIKGIFILDGPLILNEVLAEYRHHHKELLIFKVDFEKVFDSLRWDFLDAAMDKMGFGSKWRSWIMGCLKHARSSILVNGSLTKEFEVFRGLKINIDKSSVLGVCVSDVDVYHMANIIGYGVLKFPFKYLGVAVRCNMKRCVYWNAVIQKFESKISSWKARLLSAGGHLSLIKAVLGNLPTYFMSLYMMPTSICSKLESLRNKFFRGAGHNESNMSWVKWDKSLASIKKGGLGIGSIFGLNIGLLFKWIWRLRNRPTDLCAQVICIIYGHDGDKGVDLLSLCTRKLGNGVSISFWEDTWIGTSPLRSQFPPIYMLDMDKSCCIANRASLTSADWFSRILRRTPRGGAELSQFEALTTLIGSVQLIDSCDSWQWHPNYTLPTRVNLERKGVVIGSSLCPLFHLDLKTANHLFFNYELARDLWSSLSMWWNVDIPICANISNWLDWLDDVRVPSKARSFLDGAGGTLMWHIWNYQNNLIFSSSHPKKNLIWDSIVYQTFLWFSSRNPKIKFNWLRLVT
nr:RNA-directed DNA polymerase, eukaryota, reverse transcriptase zinc-binding domain protein [Tanacetum cinerariifolium]